MDKKEKKLSRLFDQQINTLLEKIGPSEIIDKLCHKREETLKRAQEKNSSIPFLPVIPQEVMEIQQTLKMININGIKAETDLYLRAIMNKVETPEEPYFIFDIITAENKEKNKISPQESEIIIERKGRSCLTTEECIALCVHTNTLWQHNIDCTGSRYEHDYLIPIIYFIRDKIKLSWNRIEWASSDWQTASCSSRY